MPFFAIFVIIPLIEVYGFITIGDNIGVFRTILLCILTAAIGGLLVKHQGLETLMKAQNNIRQGKLPLNALFDGFCIVIAGAMLITPGFFTDFIGFSLLIPPFRVILRRLLLKNGRFKVKSTHSAPNNNNPDIIEGNYEDVSKKDQRLD